MFALRIKTTLTVYNLYIGRTQPHFRLARKILNLSLQSLRKHNVIRTERDNERALGPGNCFIKGSAEPLVLLNPEVETVTPLQELDALDTIITGAIINNQQLNVRVGLRQNTGNACFNVLTVIVRRYNNRNQRHLAIA